MFPSVSVLILNYSCILTLLNSFRLSKTTCTFKGDNNALKAASAPSCTSTWTNLCTICCSAAYSVIPSAAGAFCWAMLVCLQSWTILDPRASARAVLMAAWGQFYFNITSVIFPLLLPALRSLPHPVGVCSVIRLPIITASYHLIAVI